MPEANEWLDVSSAAINKKTGERQALLNGKWVPVEAVSQNKEGKWKAYLGKYAPSMGERFKAGFDETPVFGLERRLGGEIAKTGANLLFPETRGDEPRPEENKHPTVTGPYAGAAKFAGSVVGGFKDPLNWVGLGLKGIAKPAITMAGTAGLEDLVNQRVRGGPVDSQRLAMNAGAAGTMGMVAGKLFGGSSTGLRAGGRETSEEILKRRLAGASKTGDLPSVDIQDSDLDQMLGNMEDRARLFGGPSKPIERPEVTAGKKTKTGVGPEGITGDPEEGNLKLMDAWRAEARIEPRVGMITEPPPEGFSRIQDSGLEMPGVGKEGFYRIQDPGELPMPAGKTEPLFGKPAAGANKGAGNINYDKDSLLTAIAKLGGLNMEHQNDLVGEKIKARLPAEVSKAFKAKGRAFDDMLRALNEEGYIPPEAMASDGGYAWLQEAISAEAMGTGKFYSLRASEDVLFGRMRDQGTLYSNPFGVVKSRGGATAGGAVLGGAAGAGLDPDDPVQGAIYGAAGGATAGNLLARKFIQGGYGSALQAAGSKEGAKFFNEVSARQEAWQRSATATLDQLEGLQKKIPKARQRAVIDAIEQGNLQGLSQDEQVLATTFMGAVGQIGTEAQSVGLIPRLRQNYVPLQLDWSDKHTATYLKNLGYTPPREGTRTLGFTTFTPHELERTFSSYADAARMNLKPRTTDLSDIYRSYANSVIRATENKRAVTLLKSLKGPNGQPLVAPTGSNAGWTEFRNMRDVQVPELDGMSIHPDLADSVQLGLSSYEPSTIARAAMATAWATKRIMVGYSGFHQTNLMLAYMSSQGIRGVGSTLDFALGAGASGLNKASGDNIPKLYHSAVDKAIQSYRQGGMGDSIDYGIRNGLKLGAPLEEKQGRDLVSQFGKKIDQYVPGAGKVGGAIGTVDNAFQHFTFDYSLTGFKLVTFSRLFEKEVVRNTKAAAAGKEQLRDVNHIAADVANFTNATFGGMDFRRVAEDVQTKYLDKAAQTLASPRGQAYSQVALFAPDWKLSTIASWTRGLGLSSNTPELERFHQQYLGWGAFYTLAIADGLNMQMSGHHLWENKFPHFHEKESASTRLVDMTRIDLGDGQYIEWNKHFNEGPHLAADPRKWAANALAVPASAAVAGLSGQKYPGGPPMHKPNSDTWTQLMDWSNWLVNKVSPITAQGYEKGLKEGALGQAGLPVYGKKKSQGTPLRDD